MLKQIAAAIWFQNIEPEIKSNNALENWSDLSIYLVQIIKILEVRN
jgi:hypothetical protein